MKQAIIATALLVLVGGINPQERPSEATQEPLTAEQAQPVKNTNEKEKAVTKPPVLSEAEQRKQLIKDNPHKCDQASQWIVWPDGKCKDKVVSVARSEATPAPATSYPVGCEHYRHLIAKYSWNVDTMMYAMKHESGCNPNAVGDNYTINGVYAPSCGLLQVRTLAGRPSCAALKDPATNIATAFAIWQGQGYRAWSVLH